MGSTGRLVFAFQGEIYAIPWQPRCVFGDERWAVSTSPLAGNRLRGQSGTPAPATALHCTRGYSSGPVASGGGQGYSGRASNSFGRCRSG